MLETATAGGYGYGPRALFGFRSERPLAQPHGWILAGPRS